MSHLIAKSLILVGLIIVVFGILILVLDKVPFLGKLPGDITIRFRNGGFHFPIVSCMIISIIASLFISVFLKK